MDEHTAQIEHLISHYLHRDLFRIHARDYLHRRRTSAVHRQHIEIGAISHWKQNGDRLDDWQPIEYTVNRTRESLKRAKPVTLRYLHDLLHAEPMLTIHEHAHQDGLIFTYVIHEAEF